VEERDEDFATDLSQAILVSHLDMIKEPHVSELARVLNDCLLKAQLQNPDASG